MLGWELRVALAEVLCRSKLFLPALVKDELGFWLEAGRSAGFKVEILKDGEEHLRDPSFALPS